MNADFLRADAKRDGFVTGMIRRITSLEVDVLNLFSKLGFGREVLKANRTYYVRTDGNDSNDGLTNTAAGAFLTVQKAINVAGALDLSIYDVTIQLAAGHYTSGGHIGLIQGPWVGKGNVTILGDTTTPSNVWVDSTGWIAFEVDNNARLNLSGLKVTAVIYGLFVSAGGTINITGKMEFGACGSSAWYATTNGNILCVNPAIDISGNSTAFWTVEGAGAIRCAGSTVTTIGTPAFAGAFASATRAGSIEAYANTYAGTGATGPRYSVQSGGTIFTGGGVLPGNAAGINLGGSYDGTMVATGLNFLNSHTLGIAGNVGIAYAKYDFAVDGGAVSTITPGAAYNTVIPDNAIIVGGQVNVTTAVTSGGAATVAIGTSAGSSTTSILAATGKATLTLDKLLNVVPTFAAALKMTASGSITFTIGTAALLTGVIEVWVEYYVAAA